MLIIGCNLAGMPDCGADTLKKLNVAVPGQRNGRAKLVDADFCVLLQVQLPRLVGLPGFGTGLPRLPGDWRSGPDHDLVPVHVQNR